MKSIWIAALLFLSLNARSQYMEKVSFDAADSTNGYYLAIPPASNDILGVLVFFRCFRNPENLLPETRLHNVASANSLLTVYASLGSKVTADPSALARIDKILRHITAKYKVDTSKFVLGGYDVAGGIVLRYTERAYENSGQTAIRPAAIFAVSSSVDLISLYRSSERQLKKNYFPPSVNDARAMLDWMTEEQGMPADDHLENYKQASPFNHEDEAPGNERFLQQLPLRLYYDTDLAWQLNARHNSLYDTNIPDATELINRLHMAGDTKAEFISSKQPGMRSNGDRNASSLSIVDETDCIQWIKRVLHVFDPNNPNAWAAPYKFIVPDKWRGEISHLPGINSPHFELSGMEDIRFPPGWGNSNSEEYWSVAYLLWLDGGQKIDAEILQKNLKVYYDDHIAGAVVRRHVKIPPSGIPPARITIKKIKTEPDDVETYTGTIDMFDYLGQHPITLNVRAHLKTCNDKKHLPLFWEMSPQPFTHPLWQELETIKQKFSCEE